jgi:hypothetical protein
MTWTRIPRKKTESRGSNLTPLRKSFPRCNLKFKRTSASLCGFHVQKKKGRHFHADPVPKNPSYPVYQAGLAPVMTVIIIVVWMAVIPRIIVSRAEAERNNRRRYYDGRRSRYNGWSIRGFIRRSGRCIHRGGRCINRGRNGYPRQRKRRERQTKTKVHTGL